MKNWRLSLMFLVIFSLILSACSGEENVSGDKEANAEAVEGGTLEFAFNAQPPTLDPLGTTATATRDISRNIFEQLVTFDSQMEVQPMLAESFEIDEENSTVTFKLREDVLFHNGEVMDAEDVIASMERWVEKSAQASSFLSGTTFTAEDEHTVVAQLEQIGSIDMYIFADVTQIAAIMPKEVIAAENETGITEFIGTGPYKLAEWKQDQHIHLEKFDDYVSRSEEPDGLAGKKNAYVDEIFFHIVTDASTRVNGLMTGEYHIGNFIPYDNAAQLDADPNIENSIQEASFGGLVFNKKEGVFTDIKMRQAVAAALNMEDMMTAAYGSEEFYSLNHALMTEQQTAWYTDAGKENYDQRDPEKAKDLLAEAGYNGEEVRILTSREYDDYYNLAVVAQQNLEKIGMNVKLDVYDWATVLERREDPTAYEIFTSGWALRPTPVQYPFLDSEAQWPGWTESDKIDEAIDGILAATDPEEALRLTEELQTEFWNYLPIIKPGNSMEITSFRTDTTGFDYLVGPILWNVSVGG